MSPKALRGASICTARLCPHVTVKGSLLTRSPDFSMVAGASASEHSFTTNLAVLPRETQHFFPVSSSAEFSSNVH